MQQSFTDKKRVLAGAAKVKITPTIGSNVGVDFKTHYARFIHDDLFAKVLLLKDENICMAIIVVDICIMSTELMDIIKDQIKSEAGIEPKHVLLCSTHTHAAGAVIELLFCSPDYAYTKTLPSLITAAVMQAKENLQPACIASGHVDVPDHVRCRRYFMKPGYTPKNPITGATEMVKTNPIGAEHLIIEPVAPTDPGLSFLAVKSLTGQWISVVGNYSLHYVGDWHVDSITADYFGEFSNQIQGLLNADENFVGMMSNGTSGDINIWDFMQPDRYPKEQLAKTKIIGKDLALKVWGQIKKAEWENYPALVSSYKEITVGIRKPSAEEIETAKEIIKLNDYEAVAIDENGMMKIYAREQLLLNNYPDISFSKLQAFKIGNLVIGALGGEFFAETGLWLKENMKGTNYFTITLANSYDGYVAPAHEIERGGYETWRARSSYLETGAENKIKEELLYLLKEILL
jgi:neutral ceramidase